MEKNKITALSQFTIIIIYYAIRQPKHTFTCDNKFRQNTYGNSNKLT